MDTEFAFDPDVALAETLPSRFYTDAAYEPVERARVFARSWQLAAHTGQLAQSGCFVATEVAGEPVVIVRDGDALRGFFNVCRHRAGPVAHGCGQRKTLQCRYHGWTYGLRGELLRAPEMEAARGFDREAFALAPVRVESFGPLVFVCVDPSAPSLAEFLGDIPARAAGTGIESMRFVMRRDYEVACNWKVYVDNYLEGYHIPVVHPGLLRELDYGAYRVEPGRYHSVQHAPLRPVESHAHGDAGSGESDARNYVPREADERAQYYWVFPNVMFNLYLGQLQTNLVVPLAVDRTRVVFEWYAADAPTDAERAREWEKLVGFSDAIQVEDAEICAAVQRNLGSRSYDRGRYSPTRENGVHHFHGLLHEFLRRA